MVFYCIGVITEGHIRDEAPWPVRLLLFDRPRFLRKLLWFSFLFFVVRFRLVLVSFSCFIMALLDLVW